MLVNHCIFFFFNPGCPGQFTRITTNSRTHWTSCKPSRQGKAPRGRQACTLKLEPRMQRQRNPTTAGLQASVLNHCIFFFFDNLGCPGQLTRTTTNPRTHWTSCKPSRQVRHRGGDRRACWGLNPGCIGREILPRPLGYKPRC